MKLPRVTVLMSVYNSEQFIAEAVESVLGQTFHDFEFLIFEDCSTDLSLNILRSYRDPRIRLVENLKNLGLTRNLAQGVDIARGEFVARMDADDVCLPHRLAVQVAYLEKHPEISVLGSAATFFDESGWEFIAHQPLEHEEIKCTLFYGFTMLHPSVMIRKADFKRRGLNYDPTFQVSQDHDLWTRAIRELRFSNVYEPLLRMREHGERIGKTRKSHQQGLSDSIRSRQLEELHLKLTTQELQAFSADETIVRTWHVRELKLYESLLIKIFEANKNVLYFDPKTLVKLGACGFRQKCREILIAGNNAGRYYWRSSLRHLDRPSMRQLTGLMVRSWVPGI